MSIALSTLDFSFGHLPHPSQDLFPSPLKPKQDQRDTFSYFCACSYISFESSLHILFAILQTTIHTSQAFSVHESDHNYTTLYKQLTYDIVKVNKIKAYRLKKNMNRHLENTDISFPSMPDSVEVVAIELENPKFWPDSLRSRRMFEGFALANETRVFVT